MTTPGSEPTGDYGYDLVHEEIAPGRPDSGVTPAHRDAGPSAERAVQLDGDYGYDEAHDL